jgi:hypothetical protein
MQQLFTARMQLIQNLTTTVWNLQAQQNQPPPQGPPPPPALVNKHREFMSHHPPTYSDSVDPLDADDWLKTEDHVWFEDRWMVASLCDE